MKTRRIGFVVPSVNTVIEDELRELLPDDVRFSCGRVTLGTGDDATQLAAFESSVPDEAGKLGDAKVDAVVLSCTSASVVRGPEYDAALTSRMAARAGAPAISATAACVMALSALDAHRICLLTPYDVWLHELEETYLRALGFDVVGSRLELPPPQLLGRVPASDIVREVIERVAEHDRPGDAVLVSCANMRVFAAVPQIEQSVQMPVVTSNQAAAWAALQLVGRSTADFQWGAVARCDALPVSQAAGVVRTLTQVHATQWTARSGIRHGGIGGYRRRG